MSPTGRTIDEHSYAAPNHIRVLHLDLDLEVSFHRRQIHGIATLTVERARDYVTGPLVLDTRALSINRVESRDQDGPYAGVEFTIGPNDDVKGAPLTIQVPDHVSHVRVHYSTSPNATALQWLDPAQTAGKKQPFLFTQSQSIHARSWIPLQDSPATRITYRARVRRPDGLVAVMSAENNAQVHDGEDAEFRMTRAIPPYLIALAVGDLEHAEIGPRTAVYAERDVVARAAYEFAEAERILQQAEILFGPYPWSRFDILVMPPSFPFGGMENPELIFVTPTLLSGDRSGVAVIAHELAHAWSGNLVTNATWSDFWLNEGFTTYVEYRLQELLYGASRATVERVLDQRRLSAELARLDERDQVLYVNLSGRSPDDGVTRVPYVKGALFLKTLEDAFGRERFDACLRAYFAAFRFQSVNTEQVLAFFKAQLFDRYPQLGDKIDVNEWVYRPGLPEEAPLAVSERLVRIEQFASKWGDHTLQTRDLDARDWTAHEWLHFLRSLSPQLSADRLHEIDAAFHLTDASNAEVLQQWLLIAVRHDYRPAFPRLKSFLLTIGRRLFVRPLYEELSKSDEGRRFAQSVYKVARSLYHPATQSAIDKILDWHEALTAQ